jgi:ABC-2 type transport system permease protein
MKNVLAILQKEMRTYFNSPIAYAVLVVFLLISGYFFYGILSSFVEFSMRAAFQAQYYRMSVPKMNVNEMAIRPLFQNLSVIFIFLLPMITMRLFAEEKRSGTIELLYTSPITRTETILGKYLAALALFVIMILLTMVHQAFFVIYGNPELGPVLAAYLGIFLMGASFLSLGLLISSLTENQIIAAVVGFGLFLLLWAIGWLASFAGPGLGKILSYLSIFEHFDDFAKGVIDTRDVIFYLSFTFFGLYLTYRSLESVRWR